MKKNALPIEYLIRSKHDPGFTPLKEWLVVIRHYGAPNDEKKIRGERITNVNRTGFYYKSGREEIFIPYYRILRLELSKS